MTKYRAASTMSDGQAMKRLATLTNNLRDANADLEDLLMELHEDKERWQRLSYSMMAAAMGVSRQAVQQRVWRLIGNAKLRRAGIPVDPSQLTIDDL